MILSIVLAFLSTSTLAAKDFHASVDSLPLLSVRRTKDCPNGSKLIGKQCVTRDIIQPDLVCPSGARLLNGECASFARANRVCPKGANLSAGRCFATVVVPASFTCDRGELKDKQCRLVTEAPPACPPGYKQRNSQCIRFTAQQKFCKSTYQLQGKECVRAGSFVPSPICPLNMTLIENEKCMKTVSIPPHCSDGFALIGDECIREVSRVLLPCPKGFSGFGDQCHSAQKSTTRPVCPSRFTLDSSRHCVQEIRGLSTCPPGSRRRSSDQCESTVSKIPVCDSSDELVDGHCKHTTIQPSKLECFAGYSLIHDKCKITSQASVPRCATGVLKNGECISEASDSPLLQCPLGYHVAKGPKCVKNVRYGCQKTVITTECESPSFVADLTSRNLHADHKVKPGVTERSTSKSPNCSSVTRTVPQICTKTEVTAVQYACADGSPPTGKSCRTSTEPYCEAGQLDRETGKCIMTYSEEPKRVCPIGQLLQRDLNCLQENYQPAALVCPEDSVPSMAKDGECITVQSITVYPNKVIRRSPTEVCDVGTRHGNVCINVEKIAREKGCPFDAQDRGGRCIKTSPVVIPERQIVTLPAQYVCPDGSSLSGKACVSREVTQPEYACSDGAVKEGPHCVHSQNLTYSPAKVSYVAAHPGCPKGFERQGSDCSYTSVQPAELECPPNYIRYKSGSEECTRPHAHIPRCPNGTQTTAIGCIKSSYFPPRVTEIKVCTKGQPDC